MLDILKCLPGGVFKSALLVALPCTVFSALVKWATLEGYLDFFEDEKSILKETQAFGGFSFLVGFLVVFRTSQAYSRFWEGSSATHRMRAEWFDATSSLVSFSRHSKAGGEGVSIFTNMLVRLVSMIHACALAELEIVNTDYKASVDGPRSYNFDVLDPDGLDLEALSTIGSSDCKVELVFSWIQFLIVDNISTGVLSIPPPLLSRSFQELSNGMVAFHKAMKIAYIPFPVPYAQTCDFLLLLHWAVIPFVTAQWVSHPLWAAVFTLMQVFVIWSLNFIAVEIENPFGSDDNDLDGERMQIEMNRQLMMLLSERTGRAPELIHSATKLETVDSSAAPYSNFTRLWGARASRSDAEQAATRSDSDSKRDSRQDVHLPLHADSIRVQMQRRRASGSFAYGGGLLLAKHPRRHHGHGQQHHHRGDHSRDVESGCGDSSCSVPLPESPANWSDDGQCFPSGRQAGFEKESCLAAEAHEGFASEGWHQAGPVPLECVAEEPRSFLSTGESVGGGLSALDLVAAPAVIPPTSEAKVRLTVH